MIELLSVGKRYWGRDVVSDVSFKVPRGEVLALLGGSGSGKTTTLKMCNRLIEPDRGRIVIDGTDIATRPVYQVRRAIGYVMQEVGLFPHLTVAENVEMTPRLMGWDRAERQARTRELLEAVELDADLLLGRFPHELSGGQRQRVGLARALAARPEVLLLDEAFGALDPMTRRKLWALFCKLRRTSELTVVLVTHDLPEALALGSLMGVMHEGRLLQLDRPDLVMNKPADDYVRELVATEQRWLPPEEADLPLPAAPPDSANVPGGG